MNLWGYVWFHELVQLIILPSPDGATSQSPDGALIADHESILPSDITVSETSANTSRDSHLVAPVEDTNMRSGSPSRMRASPRTVDVPVTKILDQSDPLQNYQISQVLALSGFHHLLKQRQHNILDKIPGWEKLGNLIHDLWKQEYFKCC